MIVTIMETAKIVNEYRCTRPELYPPNSPGHTDPRARQGHYVFAANSNEAERLLRRRLSLSSTECLHVELWSSGVLTR